MQKIITVFIVLLLCIGCGREHNDKEKKVGILSIKMYDGLSFDSLKGTDSYVADFISTDKKDTFHIEYGSPNVIFSLNESTPAIFPLSAKETTIKLSGGHVNPQEVVFSETPEQDERQNIFDRNYYMYDTINTIIVKIIQPKKTGNGMTGMYIPKLKNGYSFSIYALNLDSLSQSKALKMFRSIRYR